MLTIHKYALGCKNNIPVEIMMRTDAQILAVDFDGNLSEFAVWAIVDDELGFSARTFYIAGTGHDLQQNLNGNELLDSYGSFCVKPRESDISGWFHAFEVRV